nr:Biomphalaria glabrata serine/threonine-protein kinase pim-1-like [Biomphalaria glabrata]
MLFCETPGILQRMSFTNKWTVPRLSGVNSESGHLTPNGTNPGGHSLRKCPWLESSGQLRLQRALVYELHELELAGKPTS